MTDRLAGIHNDHETIAEALRRVASMINVPPAFTPEYPGDEDVARAVRGELLIMTLALSAYTKLSASSPVFIKPCR